ncbi:DUF4145 domain-containing protein [uncultured Ferrimonas sp.]|uniref:DUF4145 domain-containing protein n=1 Tax=uncultured Ferrimonas sp. TaxID=432640 RepID=UPI00260AE4E5|nr:DUF4145 domain-containing protein [uncultured Ferrimonas sp.]
MKLTTNFEFIARAFAPLYHTASLSEHYYHLDRNGCVAKLRMFAEQCVSLLMAHYQCTPTEHDENLNERLNRLSFETTVPTFLVELLHQLRSAGNFAVHAQTDGSYRSSPIAKNQAREHLKAAHELAEYLYVTVAGGSGSDIAPWQEPRDPGESYLYQLAFDGDAEACYALAEQMNTKLQLAFAPKLGQRSQQELKNQQQLLDDTEYWLRKSIRQDHWPSQLLAARICSGLLNSPEDPARAQTLFEQAQRSQEALVTFHYAEFVRHHESGTKWLKLMHRAAAGGLVVAIHALLKHYAEVNDGDAYQECVELGMAQNDGLSFALQLLMLDPEQDHKQGRSLMIRGRATGDKPMAFARGFCLYAGLYGYSQDQAEGYQLMRDNYLEIPATRHFNPAYSTFVFGSGIEPDSAQRLPMAEQAVKDSIGSDREGEVAFETALFLMKHINDKGSYKGNLVPKVLLNRACELKHIAAIDFVRSSEGKSQLSGMISVGRPKVDRKKSAAKRKAAKKARKR